MKASLKNRAQALGLGAIGVAGCAGGIHVGETDDAPGAALLGILLLIGCTVRAVKTARRQA